MRTMSIVLASSLLIVATAQAQEGGVIEPRPAARAADNLLRSILEQINPVSPPGPTSGLIEGLAADASAERLTWDRAYKLAIVRAREEGRPPAPRLDPIALEAAAEKAGFADFARFRREFLDRANPRFRDPSTRYDDLLARSRAIVHARDRLASLEGLLILARELSRGESSGLTQLQVDQINEAVQRARLDLLGSQSRYRDALDEFKVELGLSPAAAVVLDQAPVARFASVFEALIRWSSDPSRELSQLDQFVSSLAELGDVEVSGRSLLEAAANPRPGASESFIDAVGQAVVSRGRLGAQDELAARGLARTLIQDLIAFQVAKKQMILTVRMWSQATEAILAPPQPGQERELRFDAASLVEAQNQVRTCQDRLVGHWTSYHAGRLALLRDLGQLPADDWLTFRERVLGGLGNRPRPEPARAVVPDAPPPPAPPGAVPLPPASPR